MFNDIPLHPAVVHMPLGLAFVIPVLAVWAAVVSWRGGTTRAPWSVVAFLQVMLVAGAFVAMSLGEKDEEKVEDVVAEERIHAHEARGKQFAWAGVVALASSVVLIGASGPVVRLLATVAVLASLTTAGLAARAGHSGGQLVYVHGAAAPHVEAASGPAGSAGAARPAEATSDDD